MTIRKVATATDLFLIETFHDLKEGLILVDQINNILYINTYAKELLGNAHKISEIEHFFSFDVCILKEDDIIKYNPLSAAIQSDEEFKTECLYQVSRDQYKKFIIKAVKSGNNKAIFISNISEELDNIELVKQIENLKKDNKEYSDLKEKAESQAIRVGLINRISIAIRDTLNIDEIIQTSINETSKTLGVYKGAFGSFDEKRNLFIIKQEWNINNEKHLLGKEINPDKDIYIQEMLNSYTSQISTFLVHGKNILRPRLITPVVHQGKILGLMVFLHMKQNQAWHQEEIGLVEGIAAQVAAAIYQSSLFDALENQKLDLENTLLKLKNTQTQLIQSEKMASLGQLVAGVAHEINTPIGALNSNNSILMKCFEKLKDKTENIPATVRIFDTVKEINQINNEAIRRINNIVKSLKNFARLDEAELKKVDIHEGIKNTIMLINHEIKNKITIIEDYGDIPQVKCYPNALNQVFMNILVNAYQSINHKGTITIKTELKDNKIIISITDTGKGISQENISKIFDPGYTTKGVGVGTGLGLSICYQIIEKHNGHIKVDSNSGIGTKFTIELPV